MKTLIIFFSLLFGTALANNCGSINLITEPNSPFQKIPVYDQDGAGICYAYVASQLMNYDLIKQGKPLSVHPAWAAFRYAQAQNSDKLASGSARDAINAILEGGNCSYEDVRNEIKQWAEKANATEAEFIGFIDALGPRLQALPPVNGPELQTLQQEAITQSIEEQRPFCSPNIKWAGIFPEIVSMTQFGSRRLFSQLLFKGCEKIDQIQTAKPKFYLNLENQEYQNMIYYKLTSSKAPVSLMICSHLFNKPDYVGLERISQLKNTLYKTDEKCGGHEVLAVGKKKINNQCHTLIRNSWGNGFSKWTEKWKCLCKNKQTGEFVDECTIASHNNGKFSVEGCYIPDSSLSKNTFGLTALE